MSGAIDSVPVLLRLDGRSVVLVGDGDPYAARQRFLARGGAIVVNAPTSATRIGFVATDDPVASAAHAARLHEAGLLLNVADQPALCDFTLPAIIDRAPVLIAIGTSGASAGLAKALRIRLEALLPPTLGQLANGLYAARDALRARWPDARSRRHAIDEALSEGGALDPLSGAHDVATWLNTASHATPAQRLLIELASDDPDMLTLRDARLLGRADRVYHDPDIAPAVLARIRADAVRGVGAAPATIETGLTIELRRTA